MAESPFVLRCVTALALSACIGICGCQSVEPIESSTAATLSQAAATPRGLLESRGGPDTAAVVRAAHTQSDAASSPSGASGPTEPSLGAEPPEVIALPDDPIEPDGNRPKFDGRALSIDRLFEHAIQHHPRLCACKHEIAAAAGRLTQAGLLPNPNLVIDVESPLTENDPTTVSSRLIFSVPLTRKRHWRKQAECSGVEEARAKLSEETEAVFAEIADASIEVLFYQELARKQEEAAQLAKQAAEARRQRLGASFVDAASAETAALTAQWVSHDTQERLQAARDRLARAAAWPADQPIELSGALCYARTEPLDLPSMIAAVQSRRPRLAAAQANAARSGHAYRLARAEAWPDLEIGPRFQADTDGPEDRLGGRFAMDVPIFDRNQGRIAEAEAAWRASRDLLADARRNSESDVAAVFHALTALQRSLDYYSETVAPTMEKLRSQLAELEAKKAIESYQAIELRQRFLRMEMEHLERLARYSRLLVRLELWIGRPLTDEPLVL